MISLMKPHAMTVEESLLNVSGLFAISLVALVTAMYQDLWPSMLVHATFALAFLLGAYKRQVPLIPHQGVVGVLVMFLLSVIALALFGNTIILILSVVMMASAPYHLSARHSWLLLVVANGIYFAVLNDVSLVSEYAVAWLTLLALQGFAITSSLARQREVETQEILARQNSELLAARAVMAQQSQAEERLRIAGDLHDTIGHQLTALQLQLEALAHQAPEALKPQVASSQALAGDLLEDIRSIVRQMSEEKRDDLAGAIQELDRLAPGVDIQVVSTLPELEPALAQQLVFCFQEGIHNAIRHGGATHIEISYQNARFQIRDNGRGFRGHMNEGFGLANIGQRLAPFGGRAQLSNTQQGGCELALYLAEATA